MDWAASSMILWVETLVSLCLRLMPTRPGLTHRSQQLSYRGGPLLPEGLSSLTVFTAKEVDAIP